MKNSGINTTLIILLAGVFSLVLSGAFTPSSCQANEPITISVNVSPNIINLNSIDHIFGVHTSIAYAQVDTDSVVLLCDEGELFPTVCYADSNDRLVAKFLTADLDDCDLEISTDNTFTLVGEIKDSDPVVEFSGEDNVLVIENMANMQKGSGPKGLQNKWGQNR